MEAVFLFMYALLLVTGAAGTTLSYASSRCPLGEGAVTRLRDRGVSLHCFPDAEPVAMPRLSGRPVAEYGWVHVATTFKEVALAKEAGAVTVWLNEKAASDDVTDQGFLGFSLVNEFANAVCGSETQLPEAIVDAQRAAEEKDAAEEQRGRRDHYSSLDEQERLRPVAWDAKASADEPADPFSPFATPADDAPLPSWLSLAAEDADAMADVGLSVVAPDAAAPDTSEAKFCTSCGARLPRAAKFCSACGERQVEVD